MTANLTSEQCKAKLPDWRAVQKPEEFAKLLERAIALPARAVLEIGMYFGGTIRAWQAIIPEDGIIVGVDRSLKPFDHSTALASSAPLHLIEAESDLPSTVEQVKVILAGREVDLLWIDGDHQYEGVKKDFELYSPLVRRGGLIAFHDICEFPDQRWVGVRKLWDEIKRGMESEEIVANQHDWGGIGILTKS